MLSQNHFFVKEQSPTFGNSQADHLLRLALDVGEGMLRAGGEVNRVEDTIKRICSAYGAVHLEIFVIPSLLLATVRLENGEYSSQIRRVYSSENHLYRLELFNEVSREICRTTPPFEEVEQMIREAKKKKSYPAWSRPFVFALAAGAFAMFFGGNWLDGIAAALTGILLALIDMIHVPQVNTFAKIAMQSFLGGLSAQLLVMLGLGQNTGMIMIGTIMLLIPGLSFNTALRDLLTGDFLAGTLRMVQILLLALMIAFGYLLSMFVLGGVAL